MQNKENLVIASIIFGGLMTAWVFIIVFLCVSLIKNIILFLFLHPSLFISLGGGWILFSVMCYRVRRDV